MRKISTSQNFVTPTIHNTAGERGNSRTPKDADARDIASTRPILPQKRKAEEQHVDDAERPHNTRGKRVDYKQLADPYELEEEKDLLSQYTNATEIEEDIRTLADAKASPEWPEWEKAIKAELDQLKRAGTWRMVKKPPGAVPIANRWVFAKKRDKSGNIVKYKARLVAKGCAQRPGYDYNETHSPVIRLETIRAILSLVPTYKLKVQQMDVKGAYLNGKLNERVYMKQPEGYEDVTDLICELIKTLYGLKQSGREWNIELNDKLTKHGFKRLLSDPCAYIRRGPNGIQIITVWVDDLLLFTSTDKGMQEIKDLLQSEWEMTDLGEPTKIVGIEITLNERTITISQTKYIENIQYSSKRDSRRPTP
jgi:hypothetical protein